MSAEAKFWANLAALDTVLKHRLTPQEQLVVDMVKHELKGETRNHLCGINPKYSVPVNTIAENVSKRKPDTGSRTNITVFGR